MGGRPISEGGVIHVTLTQAMVDYADAIACVRRGQAHIKRRQARNGLYGSFAELLEKEQLGTRCELAGKRYLNPIRWNALLPKIHGEPDLGDFIDVKGRSSPRYDLPVQADGEAAFAYLLVFPDPHPRYCIRGWMWGFDAKQPEHWSDPAGDRPAFFVKQGLLRDPEELFAEVRQREMVVA
jgi:hypothetical protein